METPERMTVITLLMRERYGDIDERPREPRDPYRTLIGCVLSHRTRDENSSRAARNLFEEIEGPLDLLTMNQDTLKELIRCSGFYNQKARSIVAISRVLVDDFGGMVPDDRATLMGLPGVGPKTADIVLSHAYQKPAIAVDVHVSRVARRLGLAPDDAGPERVKEALESLVPPDSYRFVDNAFVRHGKEYCRNSKPRCSGCFLRELCTYPGSQSQ
ncbi:endonuclease III [Candidatus Bathyarchaeota archaeon]|nr:endonuclease III [Candidatus Bathyarchaeota archaeon]MBL7078727.1 endonuclease III [Candidatus Bathyarchaeota archaeon]